MKIYENQGEITTSNEIMDNVLKSNYVINNDIEVKKINENKYNS